MPRKKKNVEPENIKEEIVTIKNKDDNKIIVNTKAIYLFQITALTDDVKLYKSPTRKEPQGKLKKGQVYNVICEVKYTPVRMYKLDNGYYIIADQNIQKI